MTDERIAEIATGAASCPRCGGSGRSSVSMSLVRQRVAWSREVSCPACETVEAVCGWDHPPPELIRVLLDSNGSWRARAAVEGGRDALTAARQFRPDLALSDLRGWLTGFHRDGMVGCRFQALHAAHVFARHGVAVDVSRA